MPLMKLAIVMACSGMDGQYNRACNSASEAATKKIGLYDQAIAAEKTAGKIALKSTRRTLGDEPLYVIGSGYVIYKTIEKRSVAFNLPTLGMCHSASNSIGMGSYELRLSWLLP